VFTCRLSSYLKVYVAPNKAPEVTTLKMPAGPLW
jgi:hypothetical protein